MKFLVTKHKSSLPFLVIGSFFLLFTTIVHAQKYTREVNRTYEVFDDYVQITESRQIRIDNAEIYIAAGNSDKTTIFADIRPDTEGIDNSQDSLSSLTVKRSNGSNYTNYSIDSSGSNPVIDLKFDRDIEFGIPFNVNISYRSKGVIYKSGKVRDIFIPGFSEDFVFSDSEKAEVINTTVRIPKNLGNISFAIPNGKITAEGDFNIVTFNKEDLVGRSGWIEIGTEQVYEFSITQNFPKSNDIIFGTNTYKVVLPRNIKSGNITQDVFFTEISPKPVAIYEDENGNLIGEFTVPSKDSGTLSVKGYAKLTKVEIDYSTYKGAVSSIPIDIINLNTAPGDYWESNHSSIKQAAIEAIGDLDPKTAPVFSIAEKLYEYVIEKIDYSNIKRFGINERQGALKTLQGGAAVCMEYSDLYIALLRSLGIPARAVLGYGYTGIDSTDSSEHQWVEVYIPELGWISVDTTWGESAPELVGGDLNHFYVHVASKDPNTPAPVEVSFIGDIGDLQERGLTVIPTSAEFSGTSVSELIAEYPESESDGKARNIAIESGIRGVQDFYQANTAILNPILIILGLLITIPLLLRIVKLISRVTRKKKVVHTESAILKSFERKPDLGPIAPLTNKIVSDDIPPLENTDAPTPRI
jgi:transglutaminase-like putative cysteine protease